MSVLNNSNAIESGGYNIDRSLRFRSSASAYLNRTPASAGNQQKFTWSGWVKIGSFSNSPFLFSVGSSIPFVVLSISNTGQIETSFTAGSTSGSFTSQVFRDYAAWYHIVWSVDTTQATAANRSILYVNGLQVTSYASTNYPAQNTNTLVNSTVSHGIAGSATYGGYFDGYLAEVNFIDGQALTPSSFGETSSETGAWIPKKYTGTYGTNGFYLDFKNNTSATTLAYDKSGNGNNWTANNISTTAGATYDSMTDVPTLTSATAANYCVMNPVNVSGMTISDGNLKVAYTSTAQGCRSSFAMSTGKWYWEVTATGQNSFDVIGITPDTTPLTQDLTVAGYYSVLYTDYYGRIESNGTTLATVTKFVANDVIGIAADISGNSISFYLNGTLLSTQSVTLSGKNWYACVGNSNNGSSNKTFNFGQRPFSYTPPTGFKALNTFNLPDPTIKKPNQYMDATTYTGDGTNKNIVNAAGFQPDLVWVKIRNQPYSNNLTDAVRGTGLRLQTDTTAAESSGGLLAFNSNGFQVNGTQGELGTNGNSYVGWQWKESATSGFDIVTYTGNGSARTVSHSLGVAPKMMIVKSRSIVQDWPVYHKNSNATPQNYTLYLDLTNAAVADSNMWNNTAPTSSVFTVGTSGSTNQNSATYVAYLFAEIAGFSKFGSYTGNGSADGPFVYCGFRPKYVMIKRTDSGNNWFVLDSSRSSYNLSNQQLLPNSSAAESTNTDCNIDMLSNGFKLRTALDASNGSGGTYIFAAFAENPTKYALAR